jgi:protein-tyrosine-phosphatase
MLIKQDKKMKILMVCIGNICRSPMAEYILKHKVKTNNLDWIVDSAGVEGHHAGEDANAKAKNGC